MTNRGVLRMMRSPSGVKKYSITNDDKIPFDMEGRLHLMRISPLDIPSNARLVTTDGAKEEYFII